MFIIHSSAKVYKYRRSVVKSLKQKRKQDLNFAANMYV